jgi:rhodanese-related sulfurtransferase
VCVCSSTRNPDEHERGLIPTAQRLPLPELEAALRNLSDEEWKDQYSFEKPDKSTLLILYCRSGMRSQTALEVFR